MEAIDSLRMRLRQGDYDGSIISDSLSLLGKLSGDVGQNAPGDLKQIIDCATEMMLLLVAPSQHAPGPGLEVMLEAWKRYLAFLKQFHTLLEPAFCKRFVHVLQDALLSSMESIEKQIAEGEAVSAQTFGMMNFLCQRLSASICFFVHDLKISDTCAVMGLNAIASAYQFAQQAEQGPELPAKYQSFFSKAIRSPSAEMLGGASQGCNSAFSPSTIPSQQQREPGMLLLPLVSAVIAGLEGRLNSPVEGEGEVEMDSQCCYGLALLAQTELLLASEQSNSVSLRLDGLGSAALLHLLVSAITTLSVRHPGQVQDSALQQTLLTQSVQCYAAIRSLYQRLSLPVETEVVDASLLSLCLLAGQDNSYGSVKSEVARWLLCGYIKGAGEATQSQLSSSLQSLLTCAKEDLCSRPCILQAAALTTRGLLLVLCDNQTKILLLFLVKFKDSSGGGGHVREALWREVPLHALRDRAEGLKAVVTSLIVSTAEVVVEKAALYASGDPMTDENREKLGQALAVLSGCGRGSSNSSIRGSSSSIGGGSGAKSASGSGDGNGNVDKTVQEPIVDLVSVSANRAAVQFVMKVVGSYSRYLDKVYVKPSVGSTLDNSALHVSPRKAQCSLEVTLALLQVLLGQNLPPKIVSKLLIAGQVAASLAMRAAGLCAQVPPETLAQLAPCILMAANVAFTAISICSYPSFREGELELVKSMYHSLVKAAEALSSEENKQCAAFQAGSDSDSPCRGGWRLWCLLQRSLSECVASFPVHLKPQARSLLPPLYLPLMSARQQGKSATIDETGQCKYQDAYTHLHDQHKENETGQTACTSVLATASDYAWVLATQRGTGANDLLHVMTTHKEPLRTILPKNKGKKRPQTA